MTHGECIVPHLLEANVSTHSWCLSLICTCEQILIYQRFTRWIFPHLWLRKSSSHSQIIIFGILILLSTGLWSSTFDDNCYFVHVDGSGGSKTSAFTRRRPPDLSEVEFLLTGARLIYLLFPFYVSLGLYTALLLPKLVWLVIYKWIAS